jgi:FMN-dependent NADH-azoreductase
VSLFRLDASIRVDGSRSRAVADIVEQEWRDAHPGDLIVPRHVGVEPIPATAWATAVFAGRTPAQERTEEQNGALALAATLTDELVAADALVVAAPLHNFGVSQRLHQAGAPPTGSPFGTSSTRLGPLGRPARSRRAEGALCRRHALRGLRER